MSQELQRLQLKTAEVKLWLAHPTSREHDNVLQDILTIHDPSRKEFGMFWQRLRRRGPLKLAARPHGNACASFQARAELSNELITVRMDHPYQPSQAAGWAALQLYREKRDKKPLDILHVIDPLASTVEESGRDGSNAFSRLVRIAKANEQSQDGPPALLFKPHASERLGTCTEVAALNIREQSLRGVLQTIERGYQELYPGSDTDGTVAGIIGATSLVAFNNVWDAAARYDDPVRAARELLESGIFLADNSPE